MNNKKAVACTLIAVMTASACSKPTTVEPDKPITDLTTQQESASENTTSSVKEYSVGLSDIELTDELKANIDIVNKDLFAYYQKNKESDGILTEYGAMIKGSKDEEVYVNNIGSDVGNSFDTKTADNTEILLIRPSDFGAVNKIKTLEGKTALAPFTAVNTKEGYYVSSDGIEGIVMDTESYRTLRFLYMFDHGTPATPEKGDGNYEKLMNAIGMHSPYDVKHMVMDNKYALVIVGSLTEVTNIGEYLLVCDEKGSWSVGMDKLETITNVKQAVNEKYPDFQLSFLPKYVIADYGKIYAESDMQENINTLLENDKITEEERRGDRYVCGVGDFVVVHFFASDRTMVGHMAQELSFNTCKDINAQVGTMLQYDKQPPAFICYFNE